MSDLRIALWFSFPSLVAADGRRTNTFHPRAPYEENQLPGKGAHEDVNAGAHRPRQLSGTVFANASTNVHHHRVCQRACSRAYSRAGYRGHGVDELSMQRTTSPASCRGWGPMCDACLWCKASVCTSSGVDRARISVEPVSFVVRGASGTLTSNWRLGVSVTSRGSDDYTITAAHRHHTVLAPTLKQAQGKGGGRETKTSARRRLASYPAVYTDLRYFRNISA